jgi:hypothetical protein
LVEVGYGLSRVLKYTHGSGDGTGNRKDLKAKGRQPLTGCIGHDIAEPQARRRGASHIVLQFAELNSTGL